MAELGDEEMRQTLSGLLLRDLSFLKAKNAVEDRVQRLRRYKLEQLVRQQRAELLRKISTGQISPDDSNLQSLARNFEGVETRDKVGV